MSQGQSRKAQKIASDSTPRATSGLLLDSSTQDMNVDTSGQAAMGTFSDTSGQAAMGTFSDTSAIEKLKKDQQKEAKNKVINKFRARLGSGSLLRLDSISLNFLGALKIGTSNPDLDIDDYVRHDELLLSEDFEEFSPFFKDYLTYMELYPFNDDDELKIAISKDITEYFKAKKELKKVEKAIRENELDGVKLNEDEVTSGTAYIKMLKQEINMTHKPKFNELQEKLAKLINIKIDEMNHDGNAVLLMLIYMLTSIIGDKEYELFTWDTNGLLVGNSHDVAKGYDKENKSKDTTDRVTDRLKRIRDIAMSMLEELRDTQTSPAAMSRARDSKEHINFLIKLQDFLKQDVKNKKDRILIFNQTLNFVAAVKQQILLDPGEFVDSRQPRPIYEALLGKLDTKIRFGLQNWLRTVLKTKQAVLGDDTSFQDPNDVAPKDIEGLFTTAEQKYKLRPHHRQTTASWNTEKQDIIDEHNILITALQTLDDKQLDQKIKEKYISDINKLRDEIGSDMDYIKDNEDKEPATPEVAKKYKSLDIKLLKFHELRKIVMNFYSKICNGLELLELYNYFFKTDIEDDDDFRRLRSDTESNSKISGISGNSYRSIILLNLLELAVKISKDNEDARERFEKIKHSMENNQIADAFTELSAAALEEEQSLGGFSLSMDYDGGGRKPKHCKNTGIKKEILGKERCIYKIPKDRKEYVKYKGELVSIKEFKELHKKSKFKPKKEEKPTKPKAKTTKPKKEEKPTKPKSKTTKPKKEEKPTKPKAKTTKPKKEEKPTKAKAKTTKPKKEVKPTKAKPKPKSAKK